MVFTCLFISAQNITPLVRFHQQDSPYRPYYNNLLSGFMQTATSHDKANGFLQIPFVGDPLMVYLGEKDSTQFMAYASTYQMKSETERHYEVFYKRYGVNADVEQHPAYCTQTFTYPDTLVSKGFLLDIDNASSGMGNEDMDVVFINKQTIRAYKRGYLVSSETPELYYVAHFSHPFHQWNIRREVVKLEDGTKEKRCKVAFFFNLKKGEKLTVQSYVSSISTNDALAKLAIKGINVSDKRTYTSKEIETFLAQNNKDVKAGEEANNKSLVNREIRSNNKQSFVSDKSIPKEAIEVSTRNAELKAAFYAALTQIVNKSSKKKIISAQELLDLLTEHYLKEENLRETSVVETDSLVRKYAKHIFTGDNKQLTMGQLSWFLLNAIGFVPEKKDEVVCYRLVRPMFNVVTFYMANGRRFIMHSKHNTPQNKYIEKASMLRQEPLTNKCFTQGMFNRGGIMEIKMSSVPPTE